jgi:presenilin-like A22 family membrane protease
MQLTPVQDQAIAARMALIVGADNFARLFQGIQFDEFDGTVLYVYAVDEYRAAEIEETFALHISTIAGGILKCDVPVVMVLPQKLKQQRHV